MKYPLMYSEDETLDLAIGGISLARFGDGELRIAKGGRSVSQKEDEKLAKAFRQMLHDKTHALVCLPNLNSNSPAMWFWEKYKKAHYVDMYGRKEFGSTWITRPDCAPWIDRADYWIKITKLWAGKDIVLVTGDEKSLTVACGL
jgi:hypothetical protein